MGNNHSRALVSGVWPRLTGDQSISALLGPTTIQQNSWGPAGWREAIWFLLSHVSQHRGTYSFTELIRFQHKIGKLKKVVDVQFRESQWFSWNTEWWDTMFSKKVQPSVWAKNKFRVTRCQRNIDIFLSCTIYNQIDLWIIKELYHWP